MIRAGNSRPVSHARASHRHGGRSCALLAGASLLWLGACGGHAPRPHADLGSSTAAFRAVFNADSGKVRAIFLASPTCGECLHGAAALERHWLERDTSRDVAVLVVWSPQLGAREGNVASATALVSDARARHFWDGRAVIGKAFAPVLRLPGPAWDTWMLFGRHAVWRGTVPPAPAWWEHQLSAGPPALHLDPARFAAHAETLDAVGGERRAGRSGPG